MDPEMEFVGHILSQFRTEEALDIPWAGIQIKGGAVTLYWNPETMAKEKLPVNKDILKHEVKHVLDEHPMRIQGRNHVRWNYATDMTINKGLKNLPKGVLYAPKSFGLPKDYSADQCFEKIPVDWKPGQGGGGEGDEPGGEPGKDPGKDKGKDGQDPCAGHKYWEDCDPDDLAHNTIKNIAEEAISKTKGNVPGEFQAMVDKLLKSKCPWKSILKFYFSSRIKINKESTYKRRNRRKSENEVYYPGTKKTKGLRVHVIADTSGSMMDTKTITEFFTELEGIIHQTEASVRLLQWDCDQCHHDDEYKKGDWKKVGFKGGGGTSFVTFPDYMKAKKHNPDVVVFFSDMCASFPAKAPEGYTVIWLSTTDDKAPWGVNIKLENK